MNWWHAVESVLGARTWMRARRAVGGVAPVDGAARAALVISTPSPSQDHAPVPIASRLQVMLVDDSATNQRDARDLLLQWAIVPTFASDGAQALALAGERQFDIIFMDVSMPVMDGLEATWRIRQLESEHPEWPRTPIVAYTAGRVLADPRLQARIGFDEAIEKPCLADRMETCLSRWCSTLPVLLSSQRARAPLQTQP